MVTTGDSFQFCPAGSSSAVQNAGYATMSFGAVFQLSAALDYLLEQGVKVKVDDDDDMDDAGDGNVATPEQYFDVRAKEIKKGEIRTGWLDALR